VRVVIFTGVGNCITAENRDEATILCHAGLLQWLLSFHFLNVNLEKQSFSFSGFGLHG
jgi:hypothetical protein